MSILVTGSDKTSDPATRRTFRPVKIEGEPLWETIIRERR
jgi:hypothetical protein